MHYSHNPQDYKLEQGIATAQTESGIATAQISSTPKQTFLADINSRLEQQNDRQLKAMNEIQDKLHGILNKRSPDKEPMKDDAPRTIQSDYASKVIGNLNRMEENTMLLERILNHLCEIV